MIKESQLPPGDKSEKIEQIKILFNKTHEYKVTLAYGWSDEEDPAKRFSRLEKIFSLFSICQVLQNAIIEQVQNSIELLQSELID
mmetsp:Transcript_27758/g.26818  ORF Transcript_27758/g.26818 Transcript_27758/m.26818 type:complete len:85 (+) Transcript_27758:939-1193(+)